ncbi:hypothetical protein FHS51_000657 [Sphingobium wenxiniae]|uniref:Acyl-CoA transferase n=2 Tax=Sphingobium TaxID=165695 RepID=T0FZ12_9SPHN|nr:MULTISPECIES: CoA transferase [Sphingobium]EQA96610.1 hypothetical protein L485_24045 [Sphingobium baderi LL03]KMS64329.1 acyl-CoA transferase [Sphingobium baderi LL03]MBB6190444.1 hypothetical protein [Sphingobium wenxiniae]TWH95161.1 CoA transferase family III [Sphingobium wenxiniae]WRD78164.1 CoA transferase [Sphingobium baderi]
MPPLTHGADAVLDELRRLSDARPLRAIDAATLMTERAALCGFPMAGAVSAGGACHILPVRDGVIALNLPRDADWELLPALLEDDQAGASGWAGLAAMAAGHEADMLIDRARLLGLAAARADRMPPAETPMAWMRMAAPAARPLSVGPLVLDLSSLWAGPLCGHLLERCGARVIKVESPGRMDGARRGNAHFYGLLNQGKQCLSLDLADPADRGHLLDLIATADIVIESSRPRALRQWGIDAEQLVANHAGLTWIAISGHGRGAPQEDWIGYGDDAAAAAGMCVAMREAVGELVFAGDAIADPLTGIHAALAAWKGWMAGGGIFAALSLRQVVSHCLHRERARRGDAMRLDLARWHGAGSGQVPLRAIDRPVGAVGEDNGALLCARLPC